MHVEGQDYPVQPAATVFIPGNAWHAAHNTGELPLKLLYVLGVSSFDSVEYEFSQPARPGA